MNNPPAIQDLIIKSHRKYEKLVMTLSDTSRDIFFKIIKECSKEIGCRLKPKWQDIQAEYLFAELAPPAPMEEGRELIEIQNKRLEAYCKAIAVKPEKGELLGFYIWKNKELRALLFTVAKTINIAFLRTESDGLCPPYHLYVFVHKAQEGKDNG